MLTIIHVVENLDKGAVENWLVRTFLESRKTNPDWKWTFFCILGKEGRLDEKVKAAGGEIIYSPYWISEKYKFLQYFRKTLKRGKYDIIHSHHDYLSGFYLLACAGIKFKKRVLHVHNNDRALPVGNENVHKLLLPVFRKSAIHFSDLIVGISKNTLADFIGTANLKKKKKCILYYGIDMGPFAPAPDTHNSFCNELNIPEGARILLFVGRMNAEKNPVFVVDILAALAGIRNDVYAVFIGKGDEESVLKKANEYNVQDKVRLAGWRDDTAMIMKMADVFVFPRKEFPKEGLGLVVVEAQAAGLPMLLTTGIVEDAIELTELAHILPLNNNADEWAKEANKILHGPVIDKIQAYYRMEQSRFELGKATRNFIKLYAG